MLWWMNTYEALTVQLPASWLSSRIGADQEELERLRRADEVFATRPAGVEEWLYSAWQFGPGGGVPHAVRRAVRTAKANGLSEARLLEVLRRRVGLMGGDRMLDLLFEGDGSRVISEIRAAA
jgi:hypothetical protein